MTLTEEIAQFLKNRRLELNLTMEELAILLWDNPAKRSHISAYESAKKAMTVQTLELFLKALNCELKLEKRI